MAPEISPHTFQQAMQLIDKGDVAAAERLLKKHPRLANARISGVDSQVDGRTLLLYLADWPGGKPEAAAMANMLVSYGADPALRINDAGETPLHWAASNDNDAQLIEALLDAGADIEAPGGCVDQGTPLLNAAHFGKTRAVASLLRRGAPICNLRVAAGAGRIDLMKSWYLGNGLFQKDAARMTGSQAGGVQALAADSSKALSAQAVSCAVFCRQFSAADWLLDHGVDINGDLAGSTILHQVAYRGSLPMAMYLVARGADLDTLSQDIPVPAHDMACAHGNADIMNYLIDMGAALTLEQAAYYGRLDKLIKGDGTGPDPAVLLAKTVGNKTVIGKPLAAAVKAGRIAVARFLLQRYPDVATQPVSGKSALALAQEHDDAALLAVLLNQS